VRITDINGNVVNSYDYDDYGNIISQTENITNDYTYTGKELDKDSGLYYYGARYYDPEIGRWLTKDLQNMLPAMRHLRNAQKLNRYSYVLNNPMNLIDIWGLEGVPTAGVGGAGSTSGSGSAGSTPGSGGTAGVGGDGSGKDNGNGDGDNGDDDGDGGGPPEKEPGKEPKEGNIAEVNIQEKLTINTGWWWYYDMGGPPDIE